MATAIKAGKDLLTRKIHGAEQKLAQIGTIPPSQHYISVLEECQSQIREATRRLEENYTKISTLDDASMFEEYMKRLEAENVRADRCLDEVSDKIISVKSALRKEEQASNQWASSPAGQWGALQRDLLLPRTPTNWVRQRLLTTAPFLREDFSASAATPAPELPPRLESPTRL